MRRPLLAVLAAGIAFAGCAGEQTTCDETVAGKVCMVHQREWAAAANVALGLFVILAFVGTILVVRRRHREQG